MMKPSGPPGPSGNTNKDGDTIPLVGDPRQKPKSNFRQKLGAIKHLSPRAIVQIFLTVMCVGSSLMAFIFAVVLNTKLTKDLMENQDGVLKSDILPCNRNIQMDALGLCAKDTCYNFCCPEGYECQRSPTVGLYCQDGNNICGGGDADAFRWCNDYADIPGLCKTKICQERDLVHNISVPVYTISGIGVLLDLIDCVIFFAAADSILYKSSINLLSACIKWIAFGLVLGAGTQSFVSELYDNQCYNKMGMIAVQSTGEYLVSFVTTQVISAFLSMILAPISAFYGGKLIGVPYLKQ